MMKVGGLILQFRLRGGLERRRGLRARYRRCAQLRTISNLGSRRRFLLTIATLQRSFAVFWLFFRVVCFLVFLLLLLRISDVSSINGA